MKEWKDKYALEWYLKNRERISKSRSEVLEKLRYELLCKLGGCCKRCGYSEDLRGLEIDHINGDGYKEKINGNRHKGISKIRRVLEDPSLVDRFQILCGTCHRIKTHENSEHKRR